MSDKEKNYFAAIRREKLFKNIVMVILCLMSLFPFMLLVINATRSSEQIKRGISLIPGSSLATNWKNLQDKSKALDITMVKSMINSLIVTVPATLLCVYFSTLTAYGIHVYNFKLKKFAWAFIMAILMVPTQISAIGFYQYMFKMRLTDTYWPLIIPAIAAPNTVFFMKQYMESVLSLSLVEAARIDGASEFRTFNTIVLPLLKPAIATQASFVFVANWNNLFMPTLILNLPKKKTLPMFVQTLNSDQFRTDYGIVYVGLAAAILPIFVAYFFLSKFIVSGVTLGGVKE